jgi:PAS domain S-box-containing protein
VPFHHPRSLFAPAELRPLLETFAAATGAACRLVDPEGRPVALLAEAPTVEPAELVRTPESRTGALVLDAAAPVENPPTVAFPITLRGETVAWLLVEATERAGKDLPSRLAHVIEQHAAQRAEHLDQLELAQKLQQSTEIERKTSLALAEAKDLDEAVETLLSACLAIGGTARGGIYLLAEDASILELRPHRGLSDEFVSSVRTVPLTSQRGRFVASGTPFYGTIEQFPVRATVEIGRREGLVSIAIVPISHGGRPIGSVNLAFDEPRTVEAVQRDLLESLAAQAGVLIARSKAETDRQRTQRSLESLFDATEDFVILMDAKGRILHTNPVVVRRLGYPLTELRRMDLWELHPPQRRAEIEQAVSRAADGVPAAHGVPLVTRSDTHIAVEVRFSRGTWEDAPALFAVGRDVTAQRIAEAELRQSERRYRGLVESQNDLIVRVDPAGRFTFVNEAYCRTFGKTAEELYRQSFHPLVHEEDLPATLEAMKTLERPPHRCTVEQRAKTVDGWRWLFWEDVAIKDERGETVEIQAVGRDITEYKDALARAERSLRAARRARESVERARDALADALEPPRDE